MVFNKYWNGLHIRRVICMDMVWHATYHTKYANNYIDGPYIEQPSHFPANKLNQSILGIRIHYTLSIIYRITKHSSSITDVGLLIHCGQSMLRLIYSYSIKRVYLICLFFCAFSMLSHIIAPRLWAIQCRFAVDGGWIVVVTTINYRIRWIEISGAYSP